RRSRSRARDRIDRRARRERAWRLWTSGGSWFEAWFERYSRFLQDMGLERGGHGGHRDDEHEGRQRHERQRDKTELPHVANRARFGEGAERRVLMRKCLQLRVVRRDQRSDRRDRNDVPTNAAITA